MLQGRRWSRQQPLFFEHEGNRAVRHDPWKLVSELGRTETVDLSRKNRPKVAELRRMYEEWAERCGVFPWPVKGYLKLLQVQRHQATGPDSDPSPRLAQDGGAAEHRQKANRDGRAVHVHWRWAPQPGMAAPEAAGL